MAARAADLDAELAVSRQLQETHALQLRPGVLAWFCIFSVFKGVLVLYSVFKSVLVLYSVFKGVSGSSHDV